MPDPHTSTADGRVARARAAVANQSWDDAYAAFSAADDASPLGVDDLRLWATSAYLLGNVDTAVGVLGRAHQAHLEVDDVRGAARCGFWIVFILMNRGDAAQAGGWLRRSGQLLERLPADDTEHGYLMLIEAYRQVAAEQNYPGGQAVADQCIETARRAEEADLLALALNVAGRARIRAGTVEAGLALLDEAMVAVVSDELSAPVAGAVYCSLIEACVEVAELRRAREWTNALTRWCDRQHGMLTFTGQCLTHRSTILRRQGQWTAAADEAKQACQRFLGAADEAATGHALYELGEAYRLGGNLAAAEDAYRRANEWGRDPQPGLALLRLAQGRTEAAAATMRRLVAEASDAVSRIRLLPAFVQVMLAVGDGETAARAAADLLDLADRFQTSALRADADLANGAVLLARGDARGALASLRSASEAWRSLDAPYETARCRALIGLACRQLGDEDTATLELAAARHAYATLGAATELAGLPPAGDPQTHGLSRREVEVLRLVATGMTNQAIADELFVAIKTVDRHVANILTKLGVPSRTAATAFAYQHGLL